MRQKCLFQKKLLLQSIKQKNFFEFLPKMFLFSTFFLLENWKGILAKVESYNRLFVISCTWDTSVATVPDDVESHKWRPLYRVCVYIIIFNKHLFYEFI